MKYKKYGMLFILITMSILMISTQVGATAPRYMKLTYQQDTDTLNVIVLHFSPFKTVHYVYKIDVEKNGQPYTSELYSSQPRFFFNTYQFNVTAISGDQLTVTANCNLFGKLTRSVTV
jgi:hypothetical protein